MYLELCSQQIVNIFSEANLEQGQKLSMCYTKARSQLIPKKFYDMILSPFSLNSAQFN